MVVLSLCCTVAGAAAYAGSSNRLKIAILVSEDIAPFREISHGFKDTLVAKRNNADIREYFLNQDPAAVSKIKSSAVELIFTIGSYATDTVIQHNLKTKQVFAGISEPAEDANIVQGNIVGVALDVPMQAQVAYIKRFIPKLKTVAIIYNPADNTQVVQRADKIIADNGISLKIFPVHSAADVEAIKKIDADALLFIPDSVACQPKTIKTIIINSLKQGVPTLGISSSYTQAGTLLAVSADYRESGVQAAELAEQAINGDSTEKAEIIYPRKINYFINKTVAQRLGVAVQEQASENIKGVSD